MSSPKKRKPLTNPRSILFLYEGDTEREFYNRIFALKLSNRRVRIRWNNLHGDFSIAKKVRNAIDTHLIRHPAENQIHVFVAYDRDARKPAAGKIDVETIQEEFMNSGIESINEIIATQDLES